jgi:hypothetical protein
MEAKLYRRGFTNQEDTQKGLGLINPQPFEGQLKPYEPVERLRRIMCQGTENNVDFYALGFLYVLCNAGTGPAPIIAYTAAKFAHHFIWQFSMPYEWR